MTIDLAYGDNKNTILNFESYFEVRGGLGRCCVALHHGIFLGPLSLVINLGFWETAHQPLPKPNILPQVRRKC